MADIQTIYRLLYQCNFEICTDSRKATKNSVFFALQGESFDGNKYAQKALEAGCKGAVIDDSSFDKGDGYYLVEDVLKTLQDIAKYHRNKYTIPVVAITGSNGKTTTKELISSVLSEKFEVLSTKGNLNNHIGVPLTLLKLRKEHEIAIVEMGANHPREIKMLCEMAKPGYGIITNIGKAHLEGFGSFEKLKSAKFELYDYIRKNQGKLFCNRSNQILTSYPYLNEIEVMDYYSGGERKPAVEIKELNPFLRVTIQNKVQSDIQTSLVGEYNAENILAAYTIGMYFGVNDSEIAHAIHSYVPQNNRSQLKETFSNKIILDAYNANPTSMKYALENFMKVTKGRRFLILGDMLEMGEYACEEHDHILSFIVKSAIDNVMLVGEAFYQFKDRVPQYLFFSNTGEAIEHLKKNPVRNYNILIKGSRGIQLEQIVKYL